MAESILRNSSKVSYYNNQDKISAIIVAHYVSGIFY